MSDDLAAELDRIAAQIPDAAQVSHLEAVIERADAARDEPVAARARQMLLHAIYASDRPATDYLAPFTWLVSRLDAQPPWWTPSLQHTVLWTYKWVLNLAVNEPAISLPAIEDLLDGMEERYTRHGQGTTPVLERRFLLEQAVHGPLAADDLFTQWAQAPRTRYSDCGVCEPHTKMSHLMSLGRDKEALDHFWPVLERGLSCGTQPEGIRADAVELLLRAGHPQDAASAHLTGSRVSRSAPNQTGNVARHVRTLARAGQPARALELFEERVFALDRPASPREQLWFAASGGLLMRRLVAAGYADLAILDADGTRRPATEIGARLESLVQDVAQRFDVRNGTSTVSDRIGEVLDAEDLPHLPLGASARSLPVRTPVAAASDSITRILPAAAPAVDDLPTDAADLLAVADSGWREGDQDRARSAVRHWARIGADQWAAATQSTRPPDRDLLRCLLALDAHLLRSDEPLEAPERDEVVRRSTQAARSAGFGLDALLLEQAAAAAELARVALTDAEGGADEDGANEEGAIASSDVEDLARRVREAVARLDEEAATGQDALGGVDEARARGRSRAATMAPDYDTARAWVDEGLALTAATGADSADEIRWTRASLLRLRAQLAEDPASLAADLQEVLRLLHDGLLPDHRVGALTHLAAVGAHEERWDEAIMHLQEAFDLATELPSREPAIEVIRMSTQVLVGSPIPVELVTGLLERHLDYTASTGDLAACAAIRSDLASIRLDEGDELTAAEIAEVGLADLERRGDAPHDYLDLAMITGSLALTAAQASVSLGEFDRAVRAALTSEAAYLRVAEPALAARAASVVGQIHRQQGENTESLAAYRRCATLLDPDLERGDYSMLDVAAFARRCAASLSRPVDGGPAASIAFDEAQSFLSRVEARLHDAALTPDHPGPPPEAVRALITWEQASVEVDRAAMVAADGRPAEALGLLDGLEGRFVSMGEYADAIGVMISRGTLQAETGDESLAVATWTAAIHESQTHDLPHLQQQTLQRWVNWLDEQGRSDEADEVWDGWDQSED